MQTQEREILDRPVKVQRLGPGVNRYHWKGGGVTDVCVTDEPNGPMDMGTKGTKPDGATW
jgi:hypothetical protein